MCGLWGPENRYCCQFLPPFWRRQERERQRKVNRWTAAVYGLPYRTVQPAGSLISLPLFLSKISLSPSFRCDVPVGFCLEYWNSLCLVLFVRHSVRIPPPTHSWLRNVLRLPSQVSTHFITSLSPFSFFILPLRPLSPLSPHSPALATSLHILSPSLIVSLSICLLVFSGMAVRKEASMGRRVSQCQSSQTAHCKHKELLWR